MDRNEGRISLWSGHQACGKMSSNDSKSLTFKVAICCNIFLWEQLFATHWRKVLLDCPGVPRGASRGAADHSCFAVFCSDDRNVCLYG